MNKFYHIKICNRIVFVLLCVIFAAESLQAETELRAWEGEMPYVEWNYHDFQNFRIIFEKHDYAIQEELQGIIQKHYANLTEFFQNNLENKRIHIIIDSRAQYSNAYFLPAPPTIVLHTAATRYFEKDSAWLEYIFLHEIAHYLHLYAPEGFGKSLSYVFGDLANIVFSRFLSPDWVVEGLAVNIESEFIVNGRLQDPFFILPTRADILLGHFDTYRIKYLKQFEFQFGESYQYGSFMFQYLSEKYGYDTLIDYWLKSLKFTTLFKDDYKRYFDISIDEEHKLLYEKLYKRFYQESGQLPRGDHVSIDKSERTGISIVSNTKKGTLLYKRGIDTTREFVYLSEDLETEESVLRVSIDFPYYGTGLADVSKDGTKLVFVASTINPNASTTSNTLSFSRYRSYFNDVYLYDTEKKTTKRISKKQSLSMPSIDDNAKQLVLSQRHGTSSRLIRVDLEQYRKGYEILYEPTDAVILEKDFSPSAQQIVFIEKSNSDGSSLRLLNLKTGEIQNLFTSDIVHFYDPRFVSEHRIQFSSDLESPQKLLRLYEYDVQTMILHRIAEDIVGVASAVQKEDGSLLYLSNSGEGFELYQYAAIERSEVKIDRSLLVHLKEEEKQNDDSNETYLYQGEESYPRLLSFLPSRFVYWYPSARVSFSGDNFEIAPGVEFLFQSSNGLANLSLGYYQYFSTVQTNISFQPMYKINYAYSWRPFGDFLLSTSRNISYNYPLRNYIVNYIHQIGFSRLLWDNLYNMYLTTYFAARIYNVLQLEYDFNFEESFNLLQAQSFNEYVFRLNYSWTSQWRSRINPLELGLATVFNYRPPVFSTTEHELISSLSSRIRIPVAKNFVVQLANTSSHATFTSARSANGLSRFARTKNIISLFGNGSTFLYFNDEKFNLAPYKFVWSLDFIIPFGYFDDFGSQSIQPYSYYINLYTDHSFSVQYDATFNLKTSFEAGVEFGINLYLFRIPISATIGSIFSIPYNFDTEIDYRIYLLFGTNLEQISFW